MISTKEMITLLVGHEYFHTERETFTPPTKLSASHDGADVRTKPGELVIRVSHRQTPCDRKYKVSPIS